MAWIGAAIGAGAGIVGDLFSSSGQKSTNAANLAQQQQMEQWQEHMSDTAMQRRVADLKAAGLNPVTAIGQGGASTPGIAPVSLQNPQAAFGGLGGQVTSAMQLQQMQAQTDNIKADTDIKKGQRPPDVVPLGADGNPRWDLANGGIMGNYSAQQAQQNLDNARASFDAIKAAANRDGAQAAALQVQAKLGDANLNVLKNTTDALIATAKAEAKQQNAAATEAELMQMVYKGTYGPAIIKAQMLLGQGPLGAGVHAVSGAARAFAALE